MLLKLLAKLLKVLNSDADPGQISLAFCLALLAGFTPLLSLHNLLVLLLVLVLRANLSAFLLGLAAFSALGFALDPLFDRVGLALLTAEPLAGLWTALYNQTLPRIEHFNNTIAMGSLAVSLALFVPFYFLSNKLVIKYRESFLEWVNKSHLMKVFKGSKLYGYYQKVQGWRSA